VFAVSCGTALFRHVFEPPLFFVPQCLHLTPVEPVLAPLALGIWLLEVRIHHEGDEQINKDSENNKKCQIGHCVRKVYQHREPPHRKDGVAQERLDHADQIRATCLQGGGAVAAQP